MQHAVANTSWKIWAFMDAMVEYSVVRDDEQQLTMKLENQNTRISVVATIIYVKCTWNKRLVLWETLGDMTISIQKPWLVGGDFNVIRNDEENLRELPVTIAEIKDFNHCINMYILDECGFQESKYTWWNEKLIKSAYLKNWTEFCAMIRFMKYFSNRDRTFGEKWIRSFSFVITF